MCRNFNTYSSISKYTVPLLALTQRCTRRSFENERLRLAPLLVREMLMRLGLAINGFDLSPLRVAGWGFCMVVKLQWEQWTLKPPLILRNSHLASLARGSMYKKVIPSLPITQSPIKGLPLSHLPGCYSLFRASQKLQRTKSISICRSNPRELYSQARNELVLSGWAVEGRATSDVRSEFLPQSKGSQSVRTGAIIPLNPLNRPYWGEPM